MRGSRRSRSPRPNNFKMPLRARDGLQSRALIETQQPRYPGDATWMRKQLTIGDMPRHARKNRPPIVALNASPGILHQLSVFHAGRACGFARPAVQASVNVLDKRIGDRHVAQLDVNHLSNPATGRIRLQIPEPVGGAGIQAEPAMNATRVVFVDRLQSGNAGRGHARLHHDRPARREFRQKLEARFGWQP